MQTFLPLPNFEESAKVLDRARLGKQRIEVLQILNVLHEVHTERSGWRNHPAVRMWRGHEVKLCEYGLVMCDEWISRGYQDTTRPKIEQHLEWATAGDYSMLNPSWFGDVEFHLAHQSNLVRKDQAHYRTFWPDIPDDLPYVWPV